MEIYFNVLFFFFFIKFGIQGETLFGNNASEKSFYSYSPVWKIIYKILSKLSGAFWILKLFLIVASIRQYQIMEMMMMIIILIYPMDNNKGEKATAEEQMRK